MGHGSRAAQGNVEIESFAKQWQAQHPEWHIDVCFIEFADVLLDAGFDLAAKNSKKVLVVPLILNAAGHVKMEVPEHLAQARKRHQLMLCLFPQPARHFSDFTIRDFIHAMAVIIDKLLKSMDMDISINACS
jgi:sirohydrochlorin ferrochelatase